MKGGPPSIAALVASAVLAGPALADSKAPSEKDRQLASDLVKKAIARSQAGDHSTAIEIYLQAYTIVPNSLLLSNIGAEFQQNGMPKEAYKYFCMYLEKDPSGTNAPYATSQAKILARQLHKKVDDQDVCSPPKEEPDEPPPRKPKRSEPPPPPPPPPQPPVEVKRDSGNPGVMYTGVAAGIAGIAAGGLGIYYGLQGKSINDQINSHDPKQPWPPNIRDLMKEGERDNSLQIGFLVASGVLVTTGVVLYVVSRPDGTPEHGGDKTAVHVTPTTNGLAVFGRF